MSHTPSHIDNTGGGMLMTQESELEKVSNLSYETKTGQTYYYGILTPFKTYTLDVHQKNVDPKNHLALDASIPFVSTIQFKKGDHVGFRLKIIGNDECQFALAVDLFPITDPNWEACQIELQDQDAINTRINAIMALKNPRSKNAPAFNPFPVGASLSENAKEVESSRSAAFTKMGISRF